MALLKDSLAGYCELLWCFVESVMQAGPEGMGPGVPWWLYKETMSPAAQVQGQLSCT